MAGARELNRDAAADAARRAGDEGGFMVHSFEPNCPGKNRQARCAGGNVIQSQYFEAPTIRKLVGSGCHGF
jgi:hypothetical protein